MLSLDLVPVRLIFVYLSHCISQGSPAKQNQTNRMLLCVCARIMYYEELVHIIMEAENCQGLQAGDPRDPKVQL